MRDHVRAALNVYGADLASFSDIKGDNTLWTTALLKYCGIARSQGENEVDMENANPATIRAFINAISPCTGGGLPTNDYHFEHGANGDGPMGVMDVDTVAVDEFNWNLGALRQMYDFAVVMDYPIVQDMVVDKVFELYAQSVRTGRAFDLTRLVHWLNALNATKDEPLFLLLLDIMIDQCANRAHSPDIQLEPHVAEAAKHRTQNDSELYTNVQTHFCACYHLHSATCPCYTTQANQPSTTRLITTFYNTVHPRISESYEQELSAIPESDYVARGRALQRRMLLQWSHGVQEKTTLGLLKLGELKKHKHDVWDKGEVVEMEFRLAKRAHEKEVKAWQAEHEVRWKCFHGVHEGCKCVKPVEDDLVISLAPACDYEEWVDEDEEVW